MKTLVVLSVVLAVAVAIPLKPDDGEKRKQNADKDSSKDLDEFVSAFKNGDGATVGKLTDAIIKIAESGQKHSEQIVPKLTGLQEKLQKVADKGRSWLMKGLAAFLDGNRDNESYYDLETIIQWIKKRQDKGVQDELLTKALQAAKESQDHLQKMAGTFVEGIKSMRQDLSNMKEVNDKTSKTMQDNKDPFLNRFDDCVKALKAFRAKQN